MPHRASLSSSQSVLNAAYRRLTLLLSLLTILEPVAWAHTTPSLSLPQATAAPNPAAQGEKDVRPLEPGKTIEREMAGGQAHTYQITLAAGQFLRVVVEQQGIDVAVALVAPDGKQIIEVDQPIGAWGQESLSYEATVNGDYRIVIRL